MKCGALGFQNRFSLSSPAGRIELLTYKTCIVRTFNIKVEVFRNAVISLTELRNRSSKYVRTIVIIAAGGMLAATFTQLGANINGSRNTAATQSPDDVGSQQCKLAIPITRSAFQQHLQKMSSGQSYGLMAYSGMNAQALDQTVSDVLTTQIYAKSKGLVVFQC